MLTLLNLSMFRSIESVYSSLGRVFRNHEAIDECDGCQKMRDSLKLSWDMFRTTHTVTISYMQLLLTYTGASVYSGLLKVYSHRYGEFSEILFRCYALQVPGVVSSTASTKQALRKKSCKNTIHYCNIMCVVEKSSGRLVFSDMVC